MTTLLNYLKGNFISQQHQHITSVEYRENDYQMASQIFRYAYSQNVKSEDRLKIKITKYSFFSGFACL